MNRSKRVIQAFINYVKSGQYSLDYAVLLIEDNQKYGFLTEEDKAVFYAEFEVDTYEPYNSDLLYSEEELSDETNSNE